MQKDWVANSDEGLITGLLVWDLSAAFDTLDPEVSTPILEKDSEISYSYS